MRRNQLIDEIKKFICDFFEDEALDITDDTTASDVDGWDSLSHLSLINEIESEYDIKFTLAEVQGFKNVGELVDALLEHINQG